ncbi:gliding motility-associated C-terminal domain-containing protein [Hymenobacter bucti]|uniref:Gliding motility-associated C-terminal domain-containing protein n=1 Tax=Hymenobacter bucti TaxID=1844114 RepID=A0ABW4QSH1_9BACT
MNTYEATATVSDGNGQLLFYTNSENIWNRNNQVMVNGANLGGHQSASQGTIAVQNSGNAQQYYVFVVDGAENQLAGGLKYNLVDMSRQGGLGEVINRRVQVSSGQLTEKLTTVPHANGRDTWILVHGWQTNTFYAYLLTYSGLQPTPVVTNIGSVHSGGSGTYSNSNSVGYMRVSPNGSKLAVGIRENQFELFDFNPATGQLSNYIQLADTYRSYAVAFSPDSRFLYGTNLNYLQVYQFDLQAGSASAIANSGVVVASTTDNAGGLQLGPDGKLYVSVYNSPYLAVINNPNVRGTGCGFQANAVYLGGKLAQIGLPNFPASRAAPALGIIDFTNTLACAGSPMTFTGTSTVLLNDAVVTWNFGDLASGSANTATGLTATHTFATAGTYRVALSISQASGSMGGGLIRSVTVEPSPRAQLGRDTTLCGSQLLLNAGVQPAGTTYRYRWQDGSTAATFLARATGTYSVTVTSAAGCTSTASRHVTFGLAPVAGLPASITACAFNVVLIPGPQPAGTTYRWQDGSMAATYLAQTSGRYRVTITSPQGCSTTDSVRVTLNAAGPPPRLPADTTVCGATSVLLRPGGQPAGTTYLWQDGSTNPTYLVQSSGTYTVRATTPLGCTATASSRVQLGQAPLVQLRADTLVCPNAVWTLRTNPQPAGTLYRWQDGSTGATYVAHGPGQYLVEVRAATTGCLATATLRAAPLDCPVVIPNIITPNGDPQNEFFVLKGLTPSDWSLRIFDRWGRQVYDRAKYDNGWNAPGQAAGLYYYLLSNPATGERHQGWVEVVRGS